MSNSRSFIHESRERQIFEVVNVLLCMLLGLLCILPLFHIWALSLSGKEEVFSGRVYFWPVNWTLDSYRFVMNDSQFFQAYWVTIRVALIGTIFSMIMLILAAYPLSLSKQRFPARNFFKWYFVLTMMFSGGMVPTYLAVKNTYLINTIWALIIPGAMNAYFMLLLTNYMKGLPESLYDAAYIDGAGHFRTMCCIILPLCTPALASVSLFVLLGLWNDYFRGMLYIDSTELKPLQTYLRSVVLVEAKPTDTSAVRRQMLTPDGLNGAKIFLSLLPILVFYPVIQRFFITGMVAGSIKE